MEPFHDLISDSRNLSNAVTDRGMRLTRQLPDFMDDMVECNLNYIDISDQRQQPYRDRQNDFIRKLLMVGSTLLNVLRI